MVGDRFACRRPAGASRLPRLHPHAVWLCRATLRGNTVGYARRRRALRYTASRLRPPAALQARPDCIGATHTVGHSKCRSGGGDPPWSGTTRCDLRTIADLASACCGEICGSRGRRKSCPRGQDLCGAGGIRGSSRITAVAGCAGRRSPCREAVASCATIARDGQGQGAGRSGESQTQPSFSRRRSAHAKVWRPRRGQNSLRLKRHGMPPLRLTRQTQRRKKPGNSQRLNLPPSLCSSVGRRSASMSGRLPTRSSMNRSRFCDPDLPIGTTTFTATRLTGDSGLRWIALAMSRSESRASKGITHPLATDVNAAKAVLDRISIPSDVVARINEVTSSRASLIVSDELMHPRETGKAPTSSW